MDAFKDVSFTLKATAQDMNDLEAAISTAMTDAGEQYAKARDETARHYLEAYQGRLERIYDALGKARKMVV